MWMCATVYLERGCEVVDGSRDVTRLRRFFFSVHSAGINIIIIRIWRYRIFLITIRSLGGSPIIVRIGGRIGVRMGF